METLPIEMVEMIAQQFTPQDLARCSAVSREWREIFNVDWMWKPHCDPELEEPLRTIPCVVTPAFVAPEAVNSTLSPISRWKLAFMRENHLWRNWRKSEIMNKKVQITESDINEVENADFLTDNLVVVWYSNKIEILDVSVMPATLVAKTDTSINIDDDACSVNGTNMLLVRKKYSIEVFNVDIDDKSIKLKHNIHFDSSVLIYVLKKDFFLFSTQGGSTLNILNLDTGEILKKELCPVKNTYNKRVYITDLKSSPTCDFVAVTCCVTATTTQQYNNGNASHKYYIYILKECTFLPGPVADQPIDSGRFSGIALHGIWLAVSDSKTVTVYNFQTQEVILNYEAISSYQTFHSRWFNGFVFFGYELNKSWIQYYCPVDRTLATIYESSERKHFQIINNRFIAIFGHDKFVSESVLKLSGRTVEKCDISVEITFKVNRSCTKVLSGVCCVGWKLDWPVTCLW